MQSFSALYDITVGYCMLLLGRVADDAREPSVEVCSTLNLETERWIRNTGMHDF
jgi:hypothetical protein